MNAEQLIEFEKDIIEEFNAGKIAAPVHLAGGNEANLIEIFKNIGKDDWILTTWRSHLHCLLKGVPPEQVREAILKGRSIALCFPEYRVLSSAIVGGICPIAVGLAWAIKEKRGIERVHAFIGDMAAEGGIYHECLRYCRGHRLPVKWYIEDNGKSVCTDTQEVWGALGWRSDPKYHDDEHRYRYSLPHAHVGTGKWVRF